MPIGLPSDHSERLARALLALDGLSVGDSLGERYFGREAMIAGRGIPNPPWRYTDDTEMALGVVEVLGRHGRIDQDDLALTFARRYRSEPGRGYGGTAHRVLGSIADGLPWRISSSSSFGGQGSMGNGAAMRVAPLGAYFADDLSRLIAEARASAEVTHFHPEGQAGAIAVAVAAAWAWTHRGEPARGGEEMLSFVAGDTPASRTRDGIEKSMAMQSPTISVEDAARSLGNGSEVVSWDTVPFALWCASRHLHDYVEAFWTTVSGLGDRDTTCAIAGGIVALSAGRKAIPEDWLRSLEKARAWRVADKPPVKAVADCDPGRANKMVSNRSQLDDRVPGLAIVPTYGGRPGSGSLIRPISNRATLSGRRQYSSGRGPRRARDGSRRGLSGRRKGRPSPWTVSRPVQSGRRARW